MKENNARVYKKVKEKDGKKYYNFYVNVNGLEFAIKLAFKDDYKLASRLIKVEDK